MKIFIKFGLKCLLVVVLLRLLTVFGQAGYVFTTIDDPVALAAGGTTYVTCISGNIVAGYYFSPDLHGFYHVLGTTNYTTLDEPNGFENGSSSTEAYGVSGNTIVGVYQNYLNGAAGFYGFIYNIGTSNYTTLKDPEAGNDDTSLTYAYGIDGTNIIGDVIVDVPLGNDYEEGYVINPSSPNANFTTFYDPQPFLVRDEGNYYVTNYTTFANGISGANVVGYWVDVNGAEHGYLYNITSESFTQLASPTGFGCVLTGIDGNNVVGYYADPNNGYNYSGFIYNLVSGKYTTSLRDPLAPGNTFLEGISGGTIAGYYLDNSGMEHGFVASIPVPVLTLHLVGNNQIFTASNGPASIPCFIVDTTNLTLPVNQWAELSSNVFNTNGVFTYTNPIVAHQPPTFYGLSKTP